MKRQLLYILLPLTVLVAKAANVDSALVEHRSLWRMVDCQARKNPALNSSAFGSSYSELALGVDIRHQSEAFVLEKGKGFTLPWVGVNTWLRLSDRTAVWGTASYLTGTQRDITWNSTTDFDLLQPYVLADTLGGNTRRERYAFSGGYATRVGQWLLGAEMLFRAEQEYRDQDPRMRGVVTDLTLRFGAGRSLGNYLLGAAVEGNIYRQTNSVDFYSEEGVIPEYQLTGLGTEYSRFSGDKRSIYHDGGGAAFRLSAQPISSLGFYADVTLDEHRYHRKLADYNSMPLTDLYCEHVGATVGWRKQTDSRLALFLMADYTKRTGDEHVGGTSNARYFPVIACLTMYKNHLFHTAVGALYGRQKWNASARIGWRNQTEEYVYPHRQLDYGQVYGELNGQLFLTLSSALRLKLDARTAYTAHASDKVVMPYANMDAKSVLLIRHKCDYAQANYTELSCKVRADYSWPDSRYGLFVQLAGGGVFCSLGEQQLDLHASVGITF